MRLLPRRKFPVVVRYGATVLIVAVAALLRAALHLPMHHSPLLLFIPAIFLRSLLFDRGSGFLATALSAAVAAYYFIAPVRDLDSALSALILVAAFLVIGFAIAAVTEGLRETVHRLKAAERQKSFLLDELVHRTTNNLSIVSSALTLQARGAKNPEVREALEAANARLMVVANTHERLRRSDESASVDLCQLLSDTCSGLEHLFKGIRPIEIKVSCEPVTLPSSTAILVGLIVNELVTNSLKYAFGKEGGGTILVGVRRLPGSQLEISVADNGAGCPADARDGLGTRLVRVLAEKRGGSFRRESLEPGCKAIVSLRELE